MSKLNIEVKQGATFRRTIQMTDPTDTPINFDGTTLFGAIKEYVTDTTPAAEFTCTQLDSFTWEISLTSEITETLSFIVGVYDVYITWSNGELARLLEGNAVVSRGVSI